MSKASKSEIPWSPRLAHELRTLQFAREFVDSIKRVKCDQQEHKERALEIAQGFVDSLPRLADCSEKRQQNQAGRINGRDRSRTKRCRVSPSPSDADRPSDEIVAPASRTAENPCSLA